MNVQNNPLPPYRGVAINAISHENWDKAEGANRREGEENTVGCTTNSVSWVEEGAHSSWLNEAESISIAYIAGNSNPDPKSLIIHYNLASKPKVTFIIQVPAKPVYNNNTIPWRYPAGETKTPLAIKYSLVLKVTNIARTGGVTQSGMIFAPESLQNKDPMHVKKDKAPEVPKRIVIEGEAMEFLKLIHHNEYEMLGQLHKTPTRVSLLSLLINSEDHRNLLLKVLNDAYVAQDIIPENFEGIINNITTIRHLSFFEDEIPAEGRGHNQPLYIAVKAFDGSKREVMGEITLPICIGPITFDITFQVMDIRPTYSCLLGRPWIHAVEAIPSSLHQRVKFIVD
ncbi:hypothetical protein CR513_11483, partial [Mucuna pruriens]